MHGLKSGRGRIQDRNGITLAHPAWLLNGMEWNGRITPSGSLMEWNLNGQMDGAWWTKAGVDCPIYVCVAERSAAQAVLAAQKV